MNGRRFRQGGATESGLQRFRAGPPGAGRSAGTRDECLDSGRSGTQFSRFFHNFPMANCKSALKHIRKTEGRTLRNRQVKSRLKTLSKRVDAASAANDGAALAASSKAFVSALDKAAKSGIVHRNKVARHKARCARLAASAS